MTTQREPLGDKLGFYDLGNVDWHNPVDAISTIIWILMLILSIAVIPIGILVGPPGWGFLVLWYVIFEEVKPPTTPSGASS